MLVNLKRANYFYSHFSCYVITYNKLHKTCLSAMETKIRSVLWCCAGESDKHKNRNENNKRTHESNQTNKKNKETRANLSSCPSNRCHMLVFLLSQINKVFAFGFMCAIVDSNLRFAIEVFKLSIYLQLILCTTADAEVIVFKSNLHLGRVPAHTLPYLCPLDGDGRYTDWTGVSEMAEKFFERKDDCSTCRLIRLCA